MDNNDLVERVARHEYYLNFKSPRDERVLEAMRKTDRRDFLPDIDIEIFSVIPDFVKQLFLAHKLIEEGDEQEDKQKVVSGVQSVIGISKIVLNTTKELILTPRALAYNDEAIRIGYGQTCSQPAMVAFMNDILELDQEGMQVLEIGTGCGYHAAVTSHMLEEKGGRLVTIECIPELAEMASSNLRKHFGQDLEKRIRAVQGDGSIGFNEEMPYDRIYFTAGASKDFDPSILARQLGTKGIILFPEQDENRGCMVKQIYRDNEKVDEKRYDGVSFVPLKGENA